MSKFIFTMTHTTRWEVEADTPEAAEADLDRVRRGLRVPNAVLLSEDEDVQLESPTWDPSATVWQSD